MGKSIEVVGSLNIDLVTRISQIPGPGETRQASSFSTGLGGKGLNQAVACARLCPPNDGAATSSAVRMIGAVGDDAFGETCLQQMDREGIRRHDSVVVVAGQKTGTSVIVVEEATGENRIMFSPGANGALTADHLSLERDDQPGLLLCQLEVPLNTVLEAMKRGKSMGKEVVFNPAPAQPLAEDIYQMIDHLIVNESEAALLAGIPEEGLSPKLSEVADEFLAKGVKFIIITLGSEGIFWKAQTELRDVFHRIKGLKVQAVDTTAAGDTFIGAYAASLSQIDHPSDPNAVQTAVEYANRAASLSVQKEGAQASIPYFREVEPLR